MGLPVTERDVARLLEYIELLVRWNAAYNLTAVRDPVEMARRHVLDSLTLVGHVSGAVIDVGSGAGLPGIPLAILCPERSVVLLDANGKRARFLRAVKRELGLRSTRVINARAEAWEPPDGAAVTIVSRALARLRGFIEMTRCWRGAEMRWVAMKGKLDRIELADLPKGFSVADVIQVSVPGLSEERHLVIVTRSP